MPIVSTTVHADNYTQQGGGRYVIERHYDQFGIEYMVGPYLAQSGFDYDARAQSRVVEINEQLAQSEVDEELNGVAA